jgi:hypothetical protein
LLLQSAGFASPKEAGQFIAQLKASQALPDAAMAAPPDGVEAGQVTTALKHLADSGN